MMEQAAMVFCVGTDWFSRDHQNHTDAAVTVRNISLAIKCMLMWLYTENAASFPVNEFIGLINNHFNL